MAEYIEREALIKAVRIMPRTIRPELVRYSTVQAIIDKQPAADVVEVVHSKWIKRNNERRCPICHYFYMTNGTTVYNFCPMCGTKWTVNERGMYMECD